MKWKIDSKKAYKAVEDDMWTPPCYGAGLPFYADGKEYMWFQSTMGADMHGLPGALVDEDYNVVLAYQTNDGYDGFPKGTKYEYPPLNNVGDLTKK